jgi:hypothetical protein
MVDSKIIMPDITHEKRVNVYTNQSCKCANKPWAKIFGLENRECPLWKRTTRRGYFLDQKYNVIISHRHGNKFIALCDECFDVLVQKYEVIYEIEHEDNWFKKLSPFTQFGILYPDLNIKISNIRKLIQIAQINDYLIRECRCKYRIVSNSLDTITIFSLPLQSAHIRGEAHYGDVFDTLGLVTNSSSKLEWIFIEYGNTQGFINLTANDIELVQPKNNRESDSDTKSVNNIESVNDIE